MNHSIADAVAFAIKTPVGTVVMTGDFKIDATASEGIADLGRLGQLGKEGVLALLCDSTNVERPGYSASETLVAAGLERQFKDCDQRIIITTFASNAHPAAKYHQHRPQVRPEGGRHRPEHGEYPQGLGGAGLPEAPGPDPGGHQRHQEPAQEQNRHRLHRLPGREYVRPLPHGLHRPQAGGDPARRPDHHFGLCHSRQREGHQPDHQRALPQGRGCGLRQAGRPPCLRPRRTGGAENHPRPD